MGAFLEQRAKFGDAAGEYEICLRLVGDEGLAQGIILEWEILQVVELWSASLATTPQARPVPSTLDGDQWKG